jgi:hypothetical protein
MSVFVRPRNGRAQVVKDGKVVQTFGINVTTALMQGDEAIITLKNGKSQIWKFGSGGNTVKLHKTL